INIQFQATGGSGGYIWSASGLPAGMSMTADGVLGGTPATGSQGTYTPQFTVRDSLGAGSSLMLALTILQPPNSPSVVSPTSLGPATVGQSYPPVQFTATGGSGGYMWLAFGLPDGLTLTAAGLLSGMPVPQVPAVWSPTFTVRDSVGNSGSVELTLTL